LMNGKKAETVRELAVELVWQVLEKGLYSNLILKETLDKNKLLTSDRNLLTQIVNGTVRMSKHLDWVLDLFLQDPKILKNLWFRNILRVALYQILFMDKIPAYACVNDAVTLCKKKANAKLAGVCNGVLRNIIRNRHNIKYPRDPRHFLAVFYSFPEWIVSYLVESLGSEEAEKVMKYFNEPPLVTLRTNTLKTQREQLLSILEREKVSAVPNSLVPWGIVVESSPNPLTELDSFQKGLYYVQNEASMLAAAILEPHPGNLVFDLCCGVGGKTTHLAEMMENRGKIWAIDLYPHKLKVLKENCSRLGITNVETLVADLGRGADLREKADKVLLDAPCSGLGVLNRRADLRWHRSPQDLKELAQLQRSLLLHAGEMVRKGGLLLYSTCTIGAEENEKVVEGFLSGGNFALESFASKIAFFPLEHNDKISASKGMLTIMPGKYNTDGMFYALMRRTN
jgi:16S rRNA (cytosine967-C5)-methyltransferase